MERSASGGPLRGPLRGPYLGRQTLGEPLDHRAGQAQGLAAMHGTQAVSHQQLVCMHQTYLNDT